jgi:hypothetical protein
VIAFVQLKYRYIVKTVLSQKTLDMQTADLDEQIQYAIQERNIELTPLHFCPTRSPQPRAYPTLWQPHLLSPAIRNQNARGMTQFE